MNVRDLVDPAPAPVPRGTVMIVTSRDAVATTRIKQIEAQALALAEPITQVKTVEEQKQAVSVQTALAAYVKAVNSAAEEAKKPLNEVRAKIIALNKELVARADQEGARIGSLIAEFQIGEEARAAAARRLAQDKASMLERKLDGKIAQAQSLSEIEAIRDEFRDELAAQAPPVEPVRVAGQVVKQDWSVQIVDIWLLARSNPSCVSIEPRMSEIKALLNAGVDIKGIRAERVTKSGVRLTQAKTIDV